MNTIKIKFTPEKMMFPKREADNKNDFRIYSCSTDNPDVILNSYDRLSIKGIMQRLELGTEYTAEITLDKIDPDFGATYNVVIPPYQEIPETLEGQRDFLATMMTESQLNEVYKTYPEEDVIDLILSNRFDYHKVKNFGEKTLKRIKSRIESNIEFKDMLGKYARYGITYDSLSKLKDIYGSMQLASQKLDECPYVLTKLPGFGFKRADKIARAMGVGIKDEDRIKYGIRYTIEDNEQQGHTFMYFEDLIESAVEKLEVDEGLIQDVLNRTDGLIDIEDKISLKKTYNAERYIAETLLNMQLQSRSEMLSFNPDGFITEIETKNKEILKNGLTSQQQDFFRMVQQNKVGLLVGYAGTGKTQLQKFLIDLLKKLNMTYALLSPSAQAAKVTKRYTDFDAITIHRKIGFGAIPEDEEQFIITEDFVIIDEFGMADVFILSSLLSKIKNPKTRLLFVGDDFQFLSIQAGNCLHDMIQSGVLPVTKLDIVFRQEEGGLLDVATKIRKGEYFLKDDFEGKRLFGSDLLIHCVKQDEMERGYRHYYNYLLTEFSPQDIMVLSPTKKNKLGTIQINKYIQDIVNPELTNKPEYTYGKDNENVVRVGDFVLNTVNMYRKENINHQEVDIVNGDSGIVTHIKFEDDKKKNGEDLSESEMKGIIVQFDTGPFRIDFNNVPQLLAAWCRTGHKAQGDSAPAVLSVVDRSHKFQVSANMLYTMLTRAKKKGILITQAETINFAIRKVESKRRNTHLCELLKQGVIVNE
ncbi:ATP-dependent RecD-like DNA helicase [Paenibacillus sp. ISL-20]|uniref:AAA family ATPase n=1 Tax=Paenibacillus sp. ISL-20 TaxID=2819163 RepID=UPI001BEC29E9|nr:ATP-dependent RecD-like DNA helicase [Paenibacillus sp. ISL-20]MBT2759870.1 AAA family ATPase [Paenibacillus sp. ISL-20]